MDEKRKYKRLDLQVNIQMERIDHSDGVTMVKYVKVDVTDISRGGIGFITNQKLEEHSYYNTEIQIWTKEVIHTVIEIIRCQDTGDGMYHYGASFIGMTEAQELTIDIYRMFQEAEN